MAFGDDRWCDRYPRPNWKLRENAAPLPASRLVTVRRGGCIARSHTKKSPGCTLLEISDRNL